MNARKKENTDMNTTAPAPGVVDPATFVAAGASDVVAEARKKIARDKKRLTVDIPDVLREAMSRVVGMDMKTVAAAAITAYPAVRAELERLARDYPDRADRVATVLTAYPAAAEPPDSDTEQ